MEVDLSSGHIVLDENSAAPTKRGHRPQFSAHVCCGQTAGRIKIPLDIEVGLDPGNIVLDGDPAPPKQKGAQPQTLGLGPGHIVR